MHIGAIWPGAPRLVGAAYLAVDFFFLLSGFVMARTYERRMQEGALAPLGFLGARVRRLWPTMALGALLALPFLWRDHPHPGILLGAALPNLLLLPSFATAVLFPLNTPAWSIFFELTANLAHALTLHRLRTTALASLAAAFLLAAILCGAYFGNLDLGAQARTMFGGFVRVGFSYIIGILLWRWHADRPPVAVPPALAFAAMPLLFLAASAVPFEGWLFDVAFIALACPLLLWGGLGWSDRPGPAQTLALAAGAMSFPLYAVHYPVLLATEAAGGTMAAAALAALAAAALATWALGGFRHIQGGHITR